MSELPRRTRTVDQVAAPYGNFLVSVPPADLDTCAICHSAVYDGYSICFQCHEAIRVDGGGVADAVSFVSLAPAGGQLARELFTYKLDSVPFELRQPRLVGLAAVLWKWLSMHETCLEISAGVARFDRVTCVPSTSGRPLAHSLRDLVAGTVQGVGGRYDDLLTLGRTDLAQRDHAVDRYVATRPLGGESVLVIDDTWTTGAHSQSASVALKQAGASAVAVVAIGRWVDPGWRDNRTWLAGKQAAGWDWATCCIHT